jgi:hypothetical protein
LESNYNSYTGHRSSENIYVAAVERKEGMKLSLQPKLVENLVPVPVISFCKISFPVTHLIAYYDETQFTTKIGGKFSLGPSYFVL